MEDLCAADLGTCCLVVVCDWWTIGTVCVFGAYYRWNRIMKLAYTDCWHGGHNSKCQRVQ